MTAVAVSGTIRRVRLRHVWRAVRGWVAAALLVWVVAIEALLIATYARPLDPSALRPPPGDRDWVPLDQVPSITVAAVLASEDDGFWDHRGVELRGLARAAWLDLRHGELAFGGSTLSMQLARLVRGDPTDRSLRRKLGQLVDALRLERALDKRELLEQWLNRADYGNGARGLAAAARLYFAKPVAALTDAEAALLACLPRAPTAYDPYRHLARAQARRDRVLARLVASGHLDRASAARAAAPVELRPATAAASAPAPARPRDRRP